VNVLCVFAIITHKYEANFATLLGE